MEISDCVLIGSKRPMAGQTFPSESIGFTSKAHVFMVESWRWSGRCSFSVMS